MHVNLGREHFEDWRKRQEVLAQSENSSASTPFGKFLYEKRNEGNPEHDEDGDDTPLDPFEHWDKVVTTTLTRKDVTTRRVSADGKLLVKSTEEYEGKHEDLDRHHDQNVVDVETGVTIIESQESIDRKLGAQVVILS